MPRVLLLEDDPATRERLGYLPAVGDNAAVYLNGRLLGQGGRFADPVARLGARPLLVRALASLWQPGENRLYLLFKADRPLAGRMPAPAIGPEAALEAAWRLREGLAVTLPQLLATAASALALMMAVLAWYRRGDRADPSYRALTLAAAWFAVSGFVGLVVEPPLAAAHWDMLLLLAAAGVMAVAVLVGHLRDAAPRAAVTEAPGAVDAVEPTDAVHAPNASGTADSPAAPDATDATDARAAPPASDASHASEMAALTPARVLHLLRVLQEAVSNALRHGHARTLWISAAASGGEVRIVVRDDGSGFDTGQSYGGRGLKNMRRRAAACAVALDIASQPHAGTTVTLRARTA